MSQPARSPEPPRLTPKQRDRRASDETQAPCRIGTVAYRLPRIASLDGPARGRCRFQRRTPSREGWGQRTGVGVREWRFVRSGGARPSSAGRLRMWSAARPARWELYLDETLQTNALRQALRGLGRPETGGLQERLTAAEARAARHRAAESPSADRGGVLPAHSGGLLGAAKSTG